MSNIRRENEELGRIVRWLYQLIECHESKESVHFNFIIGPTTEKGVHIMPVDISMSDQQQVVVSVSPVTATGSPAKLDGPPVFAVASGDVTLITATDGMSATIVSGLDGDSTVSVSADADLGAGIKTISDTITVHVTSPQATSLGLTAATPVAKPTTPPTPAPLKKS